MKPFSIECREEGRGRPNVERFDTLEGASKYIRDRWQGAEYMDGKDGFHTDYSTYQLVGFTLSDIGKISYEDGYRAFSFNPPPRPAAVPPFHLDETEPSRGDPSIPPTRHTFQTLDDAADFMHDLIKEAGGCDVPAKDRFSCSVRDPAGNWTGSKAYQAVGFLLDDVGETLVSPDGEREFLLLNIDRPQERQIVKFADPSAAATQFARLAAADLETCRRVGAYLGHWNDRQFAKEFGHPYEEVADQPKPFFMRLAEQAERGTQGVGGTEESIPF